MAGNNLDFDREACFLEIVGLMRMDCSCCTLDFGKEVDCSHCCRIADGCYRSWDCSSCSVVGIAVEDSVLGEAGLVLNLVVLEQVLVLMELHPGWREPEQVAFASCFGFGMNHDFFSNE